MPPGPPHHNVLNVILTPFQTHKGVAVAILAAFFTQALWAETKNV